MTKEEDLRNRLDHVLKKNLKQKREIELLHRYCVLYEDEIGPKFGRDTVVQAIARVQAMVRKGDKNL